MLIPEVYEILNSKYTIVGEIDLVKVGLDPLVLEKEFYKLKKEFYTSNERIVILHDDTDYYGNMQSEGNIIYNTICAIKNAGIPPETIIIITNHIGIKDEVDTISKKIIASQAIKVIYTHLNYDYPSSNDLHELPHSTNITPSALYVCLNGQSRTHRKFFLSLLRKHDLLNKGILSYHFRGQQ